MVYTNDCVPHLVFKKGSTERSGVSSHQVKGWSCSYHIISLLSFLRSKQDFKIHMDRESHF